MPSPASPPPPPPPPPPTYPPTHPPHTRSFVGNDPSGPRELVAGMHSIISLFAPHAAHYDDLVDLFCNSKAEMDALSASLGSAKSGARGVRVKSAINKMIAGGHRNGSESRCTVFSGPFMRGGCLSIVHLIPRTNLIITITTAATTTITRRGRRRPLQAPANRAAAHLRCLRASEHRCHTVRAG